MDNGSTLLDCVRGPGWITESHDGSHGEARRVFDIPLDAEHTFVIARGVLSSGSIVLSTSNEVTDSVRIDVSLKFNHRDILDRAKVCRVRDEEGGEGVGLFVSSKLTFCLSLTLYRHPGRGIGLETKTAILTFLSRCISRRDIISSRCSRRTFPVTNINFWLSILYTSSHYR